MCCGKGKTFTHPGTWQNLYLANNVIVINEIKIPLRILIVKLPRNGRNIKKIVLLLKAKVVIKNRLNWTVTADKD